MNKELIIFDLDGTLALSKHPIDQEMSILLNKLLNHYKVAVISGGAFPQFKKQLINMLPEDTIFENLFVLPTSGTSFYVFEGEWKIKYEEKLSPEDKLKITRALNQAEEEIGFDEHSDGEKIEDRGTQITYSALGQKATLNRKIVWDPDQQKRKNMVSIMEKIIPDFSIRIGGATSIDITKEGIDKSFGIQKIIDYTNTKKEEVLFVGDALFPGGNDYPAFEMGLDCRAVKNVSDSKIIILELLREKGVEYTNR